MESILLDTNVVSELMRPEPNPVVMHWFAARTRTRFFISAVSRAEIMLGIALLPAGRRRDALAAAARAMFAEEFAGRCLPFDDTAADLYGEIVAARRRAGHATSTEDGQIAAIALAHGYPLATRNTRDFVHIEGLTLYDPWQGEG